MITNKNMNKVLSLTLLSLIMSLGANAFDAQIDGIYYNFFGDEAEVTFQKQVDPFPSYVSDYAGNIVIPEFVTDDNLTYKVTRIGHFAFNDCHNLTSVTIPNSVTSIGIDAFFNCNGLTDITIPESVTSIGEDAFYNCSGLTSVIISEGLTTISENTFAYCSGLTSVTIPESVTRIGDYAFSGCTNLTDITIPESVTSIGENAFKGTTWYNEQPEGMVYAGKVAYRYKGTMQANTEIAIDEGTIAIADNAFSDCRGLTFITIPESVTCIGKKAFSGCTGLTSITIPESIVSIGGSAFEGCRSLTKVIVPDIAAWCGISFGDYIANPLYFAQHIFSDENTEIKDLFIPAGVTSIGKAAFNNCRSLASITMPGSVTDIGSIAFYGCKSLSDVFFVARNMPNASLNAFNDLPIASVTLSVPKGTIELFRTTQPWSSFGNIVVLPELFGDLNDDNRVDIADAVIVLNIMAAGKYHVAADLNQDRKVDIADFVIILNIMAAQ